MSRPLLITAIVLLGLAAGLPNLPRPMHGDQVFTLMGAESLARGELLYHDFWDIRQPGLFVEYWLAGSAFGFNEVGIHFFDWLYWLAFAVFVSFTWPRMIGGDSPSIWPAVVIAGWYWAVTGGVQQMQPEAVVGTLLYTHLYLLMRCSRASWIAAGVLAAVVIAFKLLYLPLLGVLWLFALWRIRKDRGSLAAGTLAGWYLIAGSLSLGLALLPWLVAGQFEELSRTFFVTPRQMLDEVPRPSLKRLAEAAMWFVTRYSPVIVLAAIGVLRLWRTQRRDWAILHLAWIAASLAVIVAQRFSWWSYHFMLLAVPIGVLAAEGCRTLAESRSLIAKLLLAALLLPGIAAVLAKWAPIVEHRGCVLHSDRQAFLLREDSYAMAARETAFLNEPSSVPGPIFVAGEPIFYRYARREQATAIHGWSMEMYPAEVRERLQRQLLDARPAYVFLETAFIEGGLIERYPLLEMLLTVGYTKIRESANGVWYRVK